MEEIIKQVNEQEKLKDNIIPTFTNLMYAVSKVRSLGRAFKRGRLTQYGLLVSHRPFNNRKNTSKRKGADSRFVTTQKKRDYEYAKRRTIVESV